MIHLKDFWRTIRRTLTVFILGTTVAVFTCQAINPPFVIKHLGDGQSIVQIDEQKKFLLLPVEEASPEAKLYMIADNDVVRSMNVRLAVNKVDYFVPVDLTGFDNKHLSFNFQLIPDSALCWEEMKLSDEFDVSNREKYRPVYHFSPAYGWMNDPNGMFYKDGVYHLFYQHNPYGSMWGNMHWGHATSTDLVTWEHHGDAISPDALGTIFSGSCVVDKDNTAGFGAGAVIAFYTSASDRQVQSMAYSLDNGKTRYCTAPRCRPACILRSSSAAPRCPGRLPPGDGGQDTRRRQRKVPTRPVRAALWRRSSATSPRSFGACSPHILSDLQFRTWLFPLSVNSCLLYAEKIFL